MSNTFGKLFGSKQKQVTQPTAFETRPEFARSAFEQAVEAGRGIDPSVFAPAGLTPEQQASLGTLTAGLQPTSPEQFQQGLTTFGDPFEQQVVQSAIGDIQRGTAGTLSDIGSAVSAAGGFGGQRQALLESEVLGQQARAIGDVSGRLRSQGFQAAADRTLGDIARSQSLAPTLFGLGDVGRQIQTQQQQAPIQQSQFLAQLANLGPSGGGGIGFAPQQPGLVNRFVQPIATLGSAFTGGLKSGAAGVAR